MLCAEFDSKGNQCRESVWIGTHSLCKNHTKYYYPMTHDRLEKEMPCKRCYQAGLFRFEDGSRDIIVHVFKDQEWAELTEDQKKAISHYCQDCFGRFWVPKPEVTK